MNPGSISPSLVRIPSGECGGMGVWEDGGVGVWEDQGETGSATTALPGLNSQSDEEEGLGHVGELLALGVVLDPAGPSQGASLLVLAGDLREAPMLEDLENVADLPVG